MSNLQFVQLFKLLPGSTVKGLSAVTTALATDCFHILMAQGTPELAASEKLRKGKEKKWISLIARHPTGVSFHVYPTETRDINI